MALIRQLSPLLLLIALVAGQFVTPPEDLMTVEGYAGVNVRYKEVPVGTCELDPDVMSYSGYADIAEGQHIFWWFFEARNEDPETAPLTVWINGGPGSSSMIGLFQENGPCFIDANYQVVNNPYSWTNVTNMLYIDQPSQVGHSYSVPVPGYYDDGIVALPSNDCPDYASAKGCGTYSYPDETLTASSTEGAAPGLWATLQGFMGAFPQYARNEFYFTTESYGGHYGPVFSEYIQKQNQANIPETRQINLAGVLIGNGWFDPVIQYQAYYDYTVSPGGPYDIDFFNESIQNQLYNALYGPGNCVDRLLDCNIRGTDDICRRADLFCASQVESPYDQYSMRDEYDSRELTPDPFPPEYFSTYLNTPKVQQAIGAFVNFSDSSDAVGDAFSRTGDDSRQLSIIEDMEALLEQGISVILYAGDADYNCNYLGVEAVSKEVDAAGFESAGYANVKTSDGIVHGQVKQSGKFAFVRVYESGHEVPFYQPLISLEMLQRVIKGKDIATGAYDVTANYTTIGPQETTYREGNSTVQRTVLPADATYNTTSNGPNPVGSGPTAVAKRAASLSRKGLGRRGRGGARRRRARATNSGRR